MEKFYMFFAIVSVFAMSVFGQKYELNDFRNFFGLCWNGTVQEVLTYATNMGYTHVMYMSGMEYNKLSNGLTFVLESPEYVTYKRIVDLRKTYSPEQIAEWERICAVVFPDKKFPQNMATGWWFDDNVFSLQLDFQQKAVHDITISRIIKRIEKITKVNPNFKFGGFAWDVPQPYGDFNDHKKGKYMNRQITLEFWTGKDATPERSGIKHDYPTYFAGYFEFCRSIMDAARKINPDAKFIVEPYYTYNHWVKFYESDFFKSKGKDAKFYTADFILCEGHTNDYLKDARVFKSEFVSPAIVGTSDPHCILEKALRNTTGATAVIGSWSTIYGRYGGYDISPLAKSLRDIPASVKLARLIPVWENLNNIPLKSRSFVEGVYSSPTAYMSADVYWAKQPAKNRLLAVFHNTKGEVNVPKEYKIVSVEFLDTLFTPCGRAKRGFVSIKDNKVKITDASLSCWAFAINVEKK